MNNNEQNKKSAAKVVITGVGIVTPVGHDSVMAPSSIRAGIARFDEIPGFVTTKGAASVGSLVKNVTDERSGSDRLLSMAIPAAQEALFMAEEFYEDLDFTNGKLFLSLGPTERPSFEEFDQDDLQTLLESTQAENFQSAEIIREGNSGGVIAVSNAVSLLREEKIKFCLVGGIDSLVEFPSLAWLEESNRLKTDDRPTGFIPGEASAFLVLELEASARSRGAPILGEILNTAYSKEEAHIFSDKPLFSKGLCKAISDVFIKQPIEISKVNGIICDLNGEHYRMKEWGLAQSRLFNGESPIPELWHPAECIGDVGAASVLVYSVIAIVAMKNGYFNGPNILIWTSSDMGGRGSILLTSYPV